MSDQPQVTAAPIKEKKEKKEKKEPKLLGEGVPSGTPLFNTMWHAIEREIPADKVISPAVLRSLVQAILSMIQIVVGENNPAYTDTILGAVYAACQKLATEKVSVQSLDELTKVFEPIERETKRRRLNPSTKSTSTKSASPEESQALTDDSMYDKEGNVRMSK